MSTNVERDIGRMEATLKSLALAQERQTAMQDRLFQKLDQVGRELSAFKHEVETLNERIERVEGPVSDLARWKERAVGAAMLISFVSAGAGAAMLTGIRWLIDRLGG